MFRFGLVFRAQLQALFQGPGDHIGWGEGPAVWDAWVADFRGTGRLCPCSLQMSKVRCCSHASWLVAVVNQQEWVLVVGLRLPLAARMEKFRRGGSASYGPCWGKWVIPTMLDQIGFGALACGEG